MPDTALAISVGARRFAHPKYATVTELVWMPWLVCEGDGRPIHKDPPHSQTEIEEDITTDQQEALGYA